ncbi:MAG TPA: PIN domain nuclease [Spirochaetota bacterium]|nr:PIN domain nuclease [Spirochaetota bacterium]HQO23218.1 PIN domain nuclease [Spirochaetota bacterium]
MILVDTSILISYFKNDLSEMNAKFDQLLEMNIPFGINVNIYQELLQGAKTRNEFDRMNEYLSSIRFYDLKYGRKSYENAAKIYYTCRRKGISIRSSIDLLIAETAIENDLHLMHNDRDFDNIHKVYPELKLFS